MTEKWYDISPELLAEKLKTNFSGGLSAGEAARRYKRYGGNVIYPIPKGPFRLYLKHLLTDFTSITLLVTAVLMAFFQHRTEAVVMICLLFINLGAAVFTYIKAQRVLEGMGRNALPNAKVMRGGRLFMLKQEQLVPGDVVFISAGDIVPADCRLLESDGLTALETALTGETRSSSKDAAFVDYRDITISARKNMLYAGTIVTSGTGKAVVCDTGDDTLICATGKNTPIVSHEQLVVLDILRRYCRVMSLCMIGLIFALTLLDLFTGIDSRGLLDIFLTGLALAVAAMSEFYTAFGYIIVACGIFSAVRRYKDVNSGAMIKNTAKLEVLRDISCLIVPREAVTTVSLADIDRVYVDGGIVDSNMRGYNELSARIMRYAVVSTGIYGGKRLLSNNLSSENIYTPEEEIIIRAAEKTGIYNSALDRMFPIVEHRASGRHNRFETTLAAFSGGHVAVIRGDAPGVISCCRYYTEKGRVHPLTTEKINELRLTAAQISKKAYRVVGIATRDTEYTSLTKLYTLQSDMTFEGFICIREPLLPGAALNISKCQEAGIKVIMTSPDTTGGSRSIAAALGIIRRDDEVLNVRRLSTMSDELFRLNTSLYRLYEGVSDDDMSRVIGWLRESGEKIGVLSRGLDDIILLRGADAGFAQSVTISSRAGKGGLDLNSLSSSGGRGIPVRVKDPSASSATGCEAVKFISDVIVSEPDKSGSGGFNAMTGAISCAKVIYLNLMRALGYLLASQTARLFIVLASIIGGITIFTPVQLLFCGLILDFGAVIVVAFERPGKDILRARTDAEEQLKKPLRNNIESIFFGVVWAAVTVAAPYILRAAGIGLNAAQIASYSFICFMFTQLSVLSEIKRDKTIFRSFTFNGVYVLYCAVVLLLTVFGQLIPSFGALFGIVRLTWLTLLSAFAFPLLTIGLFELYRLVIPAIKPSVNAVKRGENDSVRDIFTSGFRVDDIGEDERYSDDELSDDKDDGGENEANDDNGDSDNDNTDNGDNNDSGGNDSEDDGVKTKNAGGNENDG